MPIFLKTNSLPICLLYSAYVIYISLFFVVLSANKTKDASFP